MSETITKKKKKIDYGLLRKLEDEYDDAIEDTERKERRLIEKVHEEYMKAENKGEFFEGLHKSETWYYTKFREYELGTECVPKTEANIKQHQERKVNDIINDLDEMQKDIEKKPFVEITEELLEDEDYVNPKEQELDWINRTKIELQAEKPKKIIEDSNFGLYQEAKTMIERCRLITKRHFKVSEKYRAILIHQLRKTKEYIDNLLEEIENE